MENYTLSSDKLLVIISTKEFIELLEYKLRGLKQAQEEDSSWSYGIQELEKQIEELKTL